MKFQFPASIMISNLVCNHVSTNHMRDTDKLIAFFRTPWVEDHLWTFPAASRVTQTNVPGFCFLFFFFLSSYSFAVFQVFVYLLIKCLKFVQCITARERESYCIQIHTEKKYKIIILQLAYAQSTAIISQHFF